MPALDRYQIELVHALEKSGWQITDAPLYLRVDGRTLFIDLQAQRINEDLQAQIVILEIKSFEGRSAVRDLEVAVGQYVIYRAILDELSVTHPLYLAIPRRGFEGILNETVGKVIRRQLDVKLLVFDIETEEIVEWLD